MSFPSETTRAFFARLSCETLDAFFPRRCLVCSASAPDGVACAAHVLPTEPTGNRCPRCAAALPAFALDAALCPACRESPPGWKRLVVLAEYGRSAALRDWTLSLKHGGRRDLAAPLGRALALRLRAAHDVDPERDPELDPERDPELDTELDVLVPVPLHFWRRLERGYDQARELAREVSRASGLRVARVLARGRNTPAQGSAGAASRSANVRGAIETRKRAAEQVQGRRVWLVDDVVTSGATASECARALRRAGAREVNVLALARAVLD